MQMRSTLSSVLWGEGFTRSPKADKTQHMRRPPQWPCMCLGLSRGFFSAFSHYVATGFYKLRPQSHCCAATGTPQKATSAPVNVAPARDGRQKCTCGLRAPSEPPHAVTSSPSWPGPQHAPPQLVQSRRRKFPPSSLPPNATASITTSVSLTSGLARMRAGWMSGLDSVRMNWVVRFFFYFVVCVCIQMCGMLLRMPSPLLLKERTLRLQSRWNIMLMCHLKYIFFPL